MKPAIAVLAVAIFGYSAGLLYGQAASEMGAAAPQQAPSVPVPSPTVPTAAPAPAQQPGATSAQTPANVPEQSLSESPAPLRVMVGKSILINTAEKLKRVSVTDPAVADAVVVTPTQLLIHGRSPGEVTLVIWDESERSRSFDLRVDVDVTAAAEEIHDLFPDQQIRVTGSRNALVLSGHVDAKETADRAGALAGAFSRNVINVLTFGPVGEQAVMLEVKFAEVDRTALAQFGVNIFSTGAGNTFGATQTGQFGGISGANVGARPSDVQGGGGAPGSTQATSAIGNQLHHQPASFGTNDLLNIFLFRTDANIGMLIRALKERNLLQILAEPNLVADNGKEASFLAGGEFPYPVIQPGTAGAVTIQFREFGVRLRFVPQIMPNGNIHLHVLPEVSSLDFANALTIQGFVVPALSTRRAETEFELRDGQSFVIAGLMDNRVTNIVNKVPGLGDIPILGELFRSTSMQKNKSELMVLVTAHRVEPSMQPSPLPTMPKPFIEDKKFDNPKPGGSQ